jgi:hypothetical protein
VLSHPLQPSRIEQPTRFLVTPVRLEVGDKEASSQTWRSWQDSVPGREWRFLKHAHATLTCFKTQINILPRFNLSSLFGYLISLSMKTKSAF